MSEHRHDETYKGHKITVLANRFDEASNWTIKVYIQTPEGIEYPKLPGNDESYQDLEVALAAGIKDARSTIDSN